MDKELAEKFGLVVDDEGKVSVPDPDDQHIDAYHDGSDDAHLWEVLIKLGLEHLRRKENE